MDLEITSEDLSRFWKNLMFYLRLIRNILTKYNAVLYKYLFQSVATSADIISALARTNLFFAIV